MSCLTSHSPSGRTGLLQLPCLDMRTQLDSFSDWTPSLLRHSIPCPPGPAVSQRQTRKLTHIQNHVINTLTYHWLTPSRDVKVGFGTRKHVSSDFRCSVKPRGHCEDRRDRQVRTRRETHEKHTRETAERQQRDSRETGETQERDSRETAETHEREQRDSRDTGERQERHRRETAERQQRHRREAR